MGGRPTVGGRVKMKRCVEEGEIDFSWVLNWIAGSKRSRDGKKTNIKA